MTKRKAKNMKTAPISSYLLKYWLEFLWYISESWCLRTKMSHTRASGITKKRSRSIRRNITFQMK